MKTSHLCPCKAFYSFFLHYVPPRNKTEQISEHTVQELWCSCIFILKRIKCVSTHNWGLSSTTKLFTLFLIMINNNIKLCPAVSETLQPLLYLSFINHMAGALNQIQVTLLFEQHVDFGCSHPWWSRSICQYSWMRSLYRVGHYVSPDGLCVQTHVNMHKWQWTAKQFDYWRMPTISFSLFDADKTHRNQILRS